MGYLSVIILVLSAVSSTITPATKPILLNGAPTKYHREIEAQTEELLRQRAEISRNFSYWMEYLKKNGSNPDLAREALGRLCYAQGKQAVTVADECSKIIAGCTNEDISVAAVQCMTTIIHEGGVDDAHAYRYFDFMEKRLPLEKNSAVKVQLALTLYRAGEKNGCIPVFAAAFSDTAFRNTNHRFACRSCVIAVLCEMATPASKKTLREAIAFRDIDAMTTVELGEALIKLHDDVFAIAPMVAIVNSDVNMFLRIRAMTSLAGIVPAHPELKGIFVDLRKNDRNVKIRQESQRLLIAIEGAMKGGNDAQ
jgi:hypothetical protein